MCEENRDSGLSTLKNSEYQKFTRDVIWVSLAQIFTQLLGIITLPALTKTYSTEIYGIWAQASVTVSLLAPLLTLQFGSAVVRFLAGEEDKGRRRRYFGSMLTTIIVLSCLVLVMAFLLSEQLSRLLFDSPDHTSFVILTFSWTFASAILSFSLAYLRARGKMGRLSIIQGAMSTFQMIVVVAVAETGLGLEWIIGGMMIIVALFICGLLFIISKEIGYPYPNFAGLREFLSFSLPQVPSGALLWIIGSSDRYFITHYIGLDQTGIYSTSGVLSSLIALFYFPISFVLLPAVSRAWEQRRFSDVKEYFEYSTKLFLTFAVPAIAGLTLLSQALLKSLATTEYLAGWTLVLLLSIGSMFLGIYQINLYIIYLVKRTKWLPLMIACAAIISAVINIILIPRIGIPGAAISNIASYFILAAIVTIWARKAISYNFDLKYLGKIVVSTTLMAVCVYFLHVDSIWRIVLAVIAGVVVYIIGLILLRSFSINDKKLIRETLRSMVPR